MWEPPPEETLQDQRDRILAVRQWISRIDFDCLSGPSAGELLEFATKLERLAKSLVMEAAIRADDCLVWRQEGHRSAAGYLAAVTGSSEGEAIGVMETARQLVELPETAKCLQRGEFSAAQVKEIASAAVVHPAAEGELIEAAARCGLKTLKTKAGRIKALASFETDEVGRENAIRKSRFLRHWIDVDGAVRLEARLTPGAGARILEAVKAKAAVFYDEGRKAGCYESMGAYMADGLEALADDAVCGTGTGIGRPTVLLRVDLPALRRGELEDDEVCEIPGIGPVSLATARRVMGDGFVKVVVSEARDIRSVCHLGRSVPVHLETALIERDRTCVVPKCDSDHRLETHHRVAVEDDGGCSLENLVRICKWHHDLISYEGWKLEGGPGSWTWQPPPDFDGL